MVVWPVVMRYAWLRAVCDGTAVRGKQCAERADGQHDGECEKECEEQNSLPRPRQLQR